MNKDFILRALKRFLRVWIASLVVLLPAVPQDYSGIKPYLVKLGVAALIAIIVALDKILRDIASQQ